MPSMTRDQEVALWDAINQYAATCGGDTSEKTTSVARMNAVAEVNRCVESIAGQSKQEMNDELLEAALRKMTEAADLLGWDIHVHTNKDEFCDGIIVGHPNYALKALEAFDAAEKE